MDKMLTIKEKRYVEKLLGDAKELDPLIWPAWGSWVSFSLGGFLIVFVCFLTATNLSTENVSSVLMPGILAGMVLLIGGYWAQRMSRKVRDKKVIAGILRKLLKNEQVS